MKRPAFQFYPADWRKDVELQSCSMAAQGLWVNILCLAHECDPYGHLSVNGKAMSVPQLARHVGLDAKHAQALLDELIDAGVARMKADGMIFSKRMVDDEGLRNRRAIGGSAGAEYGEKGASSGIKGGRPSTKITPLKTPLGEAKEPPPSSSSSSSSTRDSPIPPKGAKTAVGLKAWIESVKAKGEKSIPEGDLVFDYADEIGLPHEFLALAWREFRHHYAQPEAKKYRDWRSVFRKAVRGNWLKLWWLDGDTYTLTTRGLQAQRVSEKAA